MQSAQEINSVTGKKKKKKSVWKIIGIFLLVLILLPVLLAGALLLYISNADFTYDNPAEILAQNEPMPFSERHSFDAAAGIHTIRLDNADIYDITADILPDLRLNDSIYINAYRLSLEDEAVYLQGKVYGINVPAKVGFALHYQDGEILLDITDARLGSWLIPIPIHAIAKRFELNLQFPFSTRDVPFLSTARDVSMDNGALHVRFSVDKTLVDEGMRAWIYIRPASIYQIYEDEMVDLVAEIQEHWLEDDYKSARLDAFLQKLEKDPEQYQTLILKMLAAAPEQVSVDYFSAVYDSYGTDMMERLYPGITKEAVEALRSEMTYDDNYFFLKELAFRIDEQFASKEITIKDRQFVDTKTQAVLTLKDFAGDAPEYDAVFPEGTEAIAIYCEGSDSRQKIGTGTYGNGTAIRFGNGRCVVMCKKRDRLYFSEIDPQEYEDLASGAKSGYIAELRDAS